ncbi:MAG: class I SAM-dependent methyltransferase [Thermoplasmata archaeon]|nr:class I SAM-dependent methyltransferase [Thermoplasmata archaeon]
MPSSPEPSEREKIRDEVRRIWDENADWWDETVGEGNLTQQLILGPATDRLLVPRKGEEILDIACGNGHYARRLARTGARVVAVDISEKFLAKARSRSEKEGLKIDFLSLDVTATEALSGLGRGRFDAAVCTMALMDIPDARAVFRGALAVLKEGGRFVFSITHPSFNQLGATKVAEEADDSAGSGGLRTRYFVKVETYATPRSGRGIGIPGQPSPHYYFERPLGLLLKEAFDAGFRLDALEELTCPEGMTPTRPLSWPQFREIPPFLAARLRPA